MVLFSSSFKLFIFMFLFYSVLQILKEHNDFLLFWKVCYHWWCMVLMAIISLIKFKSACVFSLFRLLGVAAHPQSSVPAQLREGGRWAAARTPQPRRGQSWKHYQCVHHKGTRAHARSGSSSPLFPPSVSLISLPAAFPLIMSYQSSASRPSSIVCYSVGFVLSCTHSAHIHAVIPSFSSPFYSSPPSVFVFLPLPVTFIHGADYDSWRKCHDVLILKVTVSVLWQISSLTNSSPNGR